MSASEMNEVRKMLAAMPREEGTTIAAQRAAFNGMAAIFKAPENSLFLPAMAGRVPAEWQVAKGADFERVLLYFHGGGYVVGSPVSHRHLVASLSEASGMAALSIDYRMGPEHPFPAAVDDAIEAYQFLLTRGVAPKKIAVAGDSAGGGLTLALLLALRDRGLPMPGCAAPISPWANLLNEGSSYETRATRDPIVSKAGLDDMAMTYLQGRSPRAPLASPLFGSFKGLPPLLIQVGDDEILLDDSVMVAERATKAGVEAQLEIWPGMIHVFQMFWPFLGEAREAIAKIGAFCKRHAS